MNKMNHAENIEALKFLYDVQTEEGGCGPIKLGIGRLDNQGERQSGLVIYECVPLAITKLVNAGYLLNFQDGYLHIVSKKI